MQKIVHKHYILNLMAHNFSLEKCIVEGHILEDYPGSTRKAFSTFAKAKFACSKGIPSIMLTQLLYYS